MNNINDSATTHEQLGPGVGAITCNFHTVLTTDHDHKNSAYLKVLWIFLNFSIHVEASPNKGVG